MPREHLCEGTDTEGTSVRVEAAVKPAPAPAPAPSSPPVATVQVGSLGMHALFMLDGEVHEVSTREGNQVTISFMEHSPGGTGRRPAWSRTVPATTPVVPL